MWATRNTITLVTASPYMGPIRTHPIKKAYIHTKGYITFTKKEMSFKTFGDNDSKEHLRMFL